MRTYSAVLRDTSSQAVIEAAQRFSTGEVVAQSRTFAPSVAEFCAEARRIESLMPYRNRPALPAPVREYRGAELPSAKLRMRLKVPMWQYAFERGLMDNLDRANREGFGAMVALATDWGIPIPDELLAIPEAEAEQQWRTARNRTWAEVERNPPPFIVNARKKQQQQAQAA